ncbi:MAG: glycosyltransferase [Patescibacteria group bacterium]|nr:glycosyltransferase [Patescibacteria group bacterium]
MQKENTFPKMKSIILVPTYNEQENIEKLIKAILRLNLGASLVIIDDNSQDKTGEIADDLSRKYSEVKVIHRKKGLGAAYIEGLKYALSLGAEKVITMDADFSHNPNDIPRLLKESERQDIVVGSRYIKGGRIINWEWWRKLLSWGGVKISRLLLGLKIKDCTAGFKCYNRKFLEEMPITFKGRERGESKVNFKEIWRFAQNVLKLALVHLREYWFFQYRIIIFALGLLILMGTVMMLSMKDDTYTVDEGVHIAAGYSYLVDQNLRLNPEHPPLVKDLAAIPLLFLNLRSPFKLSDFREDGNLVSGAQWSLGTDFLFKQAESIEQILFWGRFPIILLTLLLGFFVFKWTGEQWGKGIGLFALFLFASSPTFLAHGRLVTMDVAAALGAFVATYYFVRFLKEPTTKNIAIAGITFGITQLFKFSLLLLFPYFFFLLLLWSGIQAKKFKEFFLKLGWYLLKLMGVIGVSLLIIFIVYQYHLWNYPPKQQAEDIQKILSSTKFSNLAPLFSQLSYIPIIRTFTQYAFGAGWQFSHVVSGHFAYFNGEGSTKGWPSYFPIVYIIKEPIPFHLFILLSLGYFLGEIKAIASLKKWSEKIRIWMAHNFFTIAALVWILLYWLVTIFYLPNIGVRYLLPIFPFMFFLVGGGIAKWLGNGKNKFKFFFLLSLVALQVISVARIYPSFLAYFNELIGPDQGYQYVVDSNLDWGQDAKRLAQWVEKTGIEKIKIPHRFSVIYSGYPGVHQFSWYNKSYEFYLKEKYEYLPPDTPTKGWIAVPVTLLQWGQAKPAAKYGWSSDSFRWLGQYQPVEIIGHSIFVYHIE